MASPDLPEPEARKFQSPQEVEGQFFSLLYAMTVFAVLYASVHKLWIPIFLKFTEVTQASYQEIDYWVVVAFALWWHLRKTSKLSWVGSFLCGALIVHGITEGWYLLGGKYFGWLQFSRMLGSVPLSLVSIAWLSGGKARERQAPAAWAGVFLAVLLSPAIYQKFYTTAPKGEEAINAIAQVFNPGVSKLANSPACGKKEFWVNLADFPDVTNKSEIHLYECGFSPVLQRLDRLQGIEITNQLTRSANIHVLIFQPEGRKRGFNRVLRPKEKFALNRANFNVGEHETVLLFSDALPESGVTALFPNQQTGFYKVSRNPLEIVPINEKTGLAASAAEGSVPQPESSQAQ